MANPPHELEERRPRKPIRIILAREVCTSPEETAKVMHRAIQDALAELRSGDVSVDRPNSADGG